MSLNLFPPPPSLYRSPFPFPSPPATGWLCVGTLLRIPLPLPLVWAAYARLTQQAMTSGDQELAVHMILAASALVSEWCGRAEQSAAAALQAGDQGQWAYTNGAGAMGFATGAEGTLAMAEVRAFLVNAGALDILRDRSLLPIPLLLCTVLQ